MFKVITDAEIEAINRFMLDIRSEIPRSIAYDVIRTNPTFERYRIDLIDEYFSVVAEIEKNNKPLSRKTKKEYLKRLLSPLKKLNLIHPSGENPYLKLDGTYRFVEEKIWIDKEINIDECRYDKEKYSINFKSSESLDYFDPDAKNITIWNEYKEYMRKKKENVARRKEYISNKKKEYAKRKAIQRVKCLSFVPPTFSVIGAGMTSVRELYEKWLPGLTQEKMKSKDLLDQILVCYTIKRALNRDQKAVDKLYGLYEDTAIGTAVKMSKKRQLNISEIDEIKQEARMILKLLISGFKPEDIFNSLLLEDNLYSKIPLWVKNLYFWYFSDHVPKEIDRIMKQPPGKLDRLDFDYLFNPISIIDNYTFWQNSPKRVMKFNSSSFRPNKKTNLTTWLFGINKLPEKGVTSGFMQGRFCQQINEILKKDYKTRTNDVLELQDDKIVNICASKPSTDNTAIPINDKSISISDKTIEDTRDHLTERGFSARNIEIVIQKLKGFYYAEIARTNNLSRRQIINICNKAKSPETID